MDLFPEVRLERTLEFLSLTDNDAAADVLLDALAHTEPRWQPRVLEALLKRRSEVAGIEVLRRWNQLGAHQKQLVARRRDWISGALQAALAATADGVFAGACLAAREIGDYTQIPHLVAVVLRERSPAIAELAGQTILYLGDRLREESRAARDHRSRHDSQMHRSQIVASLERGVRRFSQHGRREVIEALLLVADRRNTTITHVLRDPSDRAFAPLLDVLVAGARPEIMDILLDFLDDAQSPLSALHAVMRRRDPRFVRLLCRKVGPSPTATIRNNLRRVDRIPLMKHSSMLLQVLDPSEQPGAVQLAVCASIPRQQTLDFVDRVLQEGSVPGRRSAALALASLSGPDADAVAVRAMADDDGEVKAAVARHLRNRDITNAVPLLVSLLGAPQEAVREAARESLAEITFDRYLRIYDGADDAIRLAEGQLALQVDRQFVGKLVIELQSRSRSHQRRALEITLLLGLTALVEPTLAELASDEDQFIRLEAVRLLAAAGTPLSQETLRIAAHDKSALVQEAARLGFPDAIPATELLAELASGNAMLPADVSADE